MLMITAEVAGRTTPVRELPAAAVPAVTSTAVAPAMAFGHAAGRDCGTGFGGSWRRVDVARQRRAVAADSRVANVAAGLYAATTIAQTGAPAALSAKRHMISKNGSKGSTLWRFPV